MIALSNGEAAVLPVSVWQGLRSTAPQHATALEHAELSCLEARLIQTNTLINGLLTNDDQQGFFDGFKRLLGRLGRGWTDAR